jgi:SynChlorMet cassette protein ScmD
MDVEDKLKTNPMIVLREEFDDWAVLFDPDTGDSFGLNPVCVFIYKRLDGQHTFEDIMTELIAECINPPDNAEKYVMKFIEDLVEKGIAGHEFNQN